MAAAKKPLEFHAKWLWGPDARVEDTDEDDEDNNDGAENGFSMEEVLRLGGTKVTAWASRRRGSEARGVVPRVAPELRSWGASGTQFLARKCALRASGTTSFPLLFTR